MTEHSITSRIEAVLMTADRPLGERKIASILGLIADSEATEESKSETSSPPIKQVRDSVEALNGEYEKTGRSFRIESVAGGLQILTLPEFNEDIGRLKGVRNQAKLSQAALETLAIIAYRQPILRADLESIRGVACGEVLRGLMERRLVKIAGRAEELGRPMLYGTTKEFLEIFGLASLDDLPQAKELRPAPAKAAPKADQPASGSESESESEPEAEANAEPATSDSD